MASEKTTQDGRLLRITTPLEKDFLLINTLSGTEALSELFSYEIEVLHEEPEYSLQPTQIDLQKIIGQRVIVEILQPDNTMRYFNAMVRSFRQGMRQSRFSVYTMEVVPAVWVLTQVRRSRIFQHKSTPEILTEVLKGFDVRFELQGQFNKRNYCVQYRESDFNFMSRLMEEDGIYYFFEHDQTKHTMVVANTPQSHPDCPSKSDIPFYTTAEDEGFIATINHFEHHTRLQSGKVTLWDHQFELPGNKLEAQKMSIYNLGQNQELEIYDFPGGYARMFDGVDSGGGDASGELQKVFGERSKCVEIAMQAIDSDQTVFVGTGDCSSMLAGHRFAMSNHQDESLNGQYVITALDHKMVQSPTYISDESPSGAYSNNFTAIKCGSGSPPFRPRARSPKPAVLGSQTASVVGPSGDEIFTDKYGRVKVQFHWDREGKYDASSSCWLRVATSLAGNKWGTQYIPRIGQEVIVDFLEGDPDQPIIIGSVRNPQTMPHYELPKYKTLTYIKTRTSPDDGKGYNELRFEDKAGKEQVFIRSQKRMDVRVRGSLYETCGGNRQEVIGVRSDNQPGGNLAITVGGNYDLHVKGDTFIGLDTGLYEGVKSNVAEEYKGNQQTFVTSKIELNAKEIVLEGSMKVVLKVGSSCVIVDMMGITIQGPMVKINSGGSAPPTGPMKMADPVDAEYSDNGEPGYLDKPRKYTGGGKSRWRNVPGQHAPSVTRNSDGTYSVGGDKIKVKGDDKFVGKALNDLSEIYNTPSGKKLMDNINGGARDVNIQESPIDPKTGKRSTGFATKANPADAENGTGTDTTISYNTDGTKAKDQNGDPIDIPGKEVLAHELIHADHNSSGTNLSSQPDPKDPTGNQEESRTIGINDHEDEPISENQILKEWGADYQRKDHDGGFVRDKK